MHISTSPAWLGFMRPMPGAEATEMSGWGELCHHAAWFGFGFGFGLGIGLANLARVELGVRGRGRR